MSYPILYKADETDFSHLGLGILTDTVECLVTEERNGMYELTMQYPIDGALFSEIKNDRLVKVRASNNSHNQRFKIIRITKPAKGIVTIYAEHVSYLTADLPLVPEVSYSGSAQTALNTWKNGIVVENPFTVFSDIATIGSGKWTIDNVESARRALGGVQGSLLDTYGGEYFFDNYSIGLYANRGEDNGTLIAYGKNLVDLEQEEEISGTYTSVYPYVRTTGEDGTERLVALSEIFIDSPHKDSYARRKIRVVDFTADEIKTEEALRARAKQYIEQNNIGLPKVNLRVKFVDLAKTLDYKDLKLIEEVNLCDIVTIHFEKLGINQKAKVIKTVWNVLLDRYEEIEIGESRATLTQTISTEIKESEQHTTMQLDGLRQQIINSYWNSDGYNYDLRVGNEYGLPGGYYSFDKPIDQNPERAIYMGAGTLLIANSKDAQGNWTWRTMATGDGLIADVIAAGILRSASGESYFDLNNNKLVANNADIRGTVTSQNSSNGVYSRLGLGKLEFFNILNGLLAGRVWTGYANNRYSMNISAAYDSEGLFFNRLNSTNTSADKTGYRIIFGDINKHTMFGDFDVTGNANIDGHIDKVGNVNLRTNCSVKFGAYNLKIIDNGSDLHLQNEIGNINVQASSLKVWNYGFTAWAPVDASAFNVSSLEKYKTNIVELSNALEIIDNSKIYEFNLKDDIDNDIDKKNYGFVIGDSYSTPKEVMSSSNESINQYSMVSVLWKAVQELSEKVDGLQAEMDNLKK